MSSWFHHNNGVSSSKLALRHLQTHVSPPLCDEGCERLTLTVQRNRVEAIYSIKYRLFGVRWYLRGKLEWWCSVMGFWKTLCIESLEINGTMRGSTGFQYNNHVATPGDRSAYGDRFDYASLNISVQAGLDMCFPVMRYQSWGVSGIRDSIRFEMYLCGLACQSWEWGMVVEYTIGKLFPNVILQLWDVFW